MNIQLIGPNSLESQISLHSHNLAFFEVGVPFFVSMHECFQCSRVGLGFVILIIDSKLSDTQRYKT